MCIRDRYNIIRYIDLEGKTLTVPDNSVLNFIGGTIGNGTIIGNKTKVINLNVDRIVLSGTWFDSGITSNRPTNVLVGFQYFDSTLSVSYTHLDVYKRQDLILAFILIMHVILIRMNIMKIFIIRLIRLMHCWGLFLIRRTEPKSLKWKR